MSSQKTNTNKLTLYQLKPFNTFDHLKQLMDYVNQNVWFSPVSSFNDPFEGHFKPQIPEPNSVKKGSPLFEQLLKFYKENVDQNSTPDTFDKKLKSLESYEQIKAMTEKLCSGEFKDHGVLCFIKEPSNIPMWAHYGDNHKGYCLVYELDFTKLFEVTSLSAEDALYIKKMQEGNEILFLRSTVSKNTCFVFTKVTYSKEPPKLCLNEFTKLQADYEHTKYFVKNSIAVKFNQWSYEQEYRLIVNLNSKASGLMNLTNYFPALKLTGAIMGDQLPEYKKDIFHDLCKKHDITLFQARCSETEYKIEIDTVIIKD